MFGGSLYNFDHECRILLHKDGTCIFVESRDLHKTFDLHTTNCFSFYLLRTFLVSWIFFQFFQICRNRTTK